MDRRLASLALFLALLAGYLFCPTFAPPRDPASSSAQEKAWARGGLSVPSAMEARGRSARLLWTAGSKPRKKSAAILSRQPAVDIPLSSLKDLTARNMWQMSQHASHWIARPKIHFAAPAMRWLSTAPAQ